MNKFQLRVFLLLSFFTVSIFGQTDSKFIIAMNAWEPIKYETEPYGVLAQIAKEAFALEGVEVEFQVAPWKRGYDYVLSGRWHAIVGWNRTEERESLFHISTPLLLEDVVFFHHKDLKLDWSEVEDLEGLSVGIINGYNYGQDLRRAIDEGIVSDDATSDEEQSIRMLHKKRFDIWPSELNVGLHLIDTFLKSAEAAQLTYHSNALQVSDLCMLLSREIPENDENLKRFERGLKVLIESGRYDEIIKELLP